MDEYDLPFLDAVPAAPATDANRARIRDEAARVARAVDRRLGTASPEPAPPLSRAAGDVLHRAGGIALPFVSPTQDPAGLADARRTHLRGSRRLVECVSCAYRKLETRLPDAAITPGERGTPRARTHEGPGERDYTLCQTCFDTNGRLHPALFTHLAATREREAPAHTLRHDREFDARARRVAEVHALRAGADSARAFAEGLDGGLAERDRSPLSDAYDGATARGAMRLSDFTGQRPAEGRGRRGAADPEFAAGAPYDAALHRADEAEARQLDAAWEQRRIHAFRRAWEQTSGISEPALQEAVRRRLVEAWDPRMPVQRHGVPYATNPFAAAEKSPLPRRGAFATSGADEGREAAEPPPPALARHEARLTAFLETVRARLRAQGLSAEEVRERTTLPELTPEREWIRRRAETPLHERLLGASPPFALPPTAELDAAVRHGEDARWARERLREIEPPALPPDSGRVLQDAVRRESAAALAERIRRRSAEVDALEGRAQAMARAEQALGRTSQRFSAEVATCLRDPAAFRAEFRALDLGGKRVALAALREGSTPPGPLGDAATLLPMDGAARERAGLALHRAGEAYLEAALLRETTRRHAARAVGLPESTRAPSVRDALTEATADGRRALDADRAELAALGPVPSGREIARALAALGAGERQAVLREAPALKELLPGPPVRSRRHRGLSL